MNIRLVISLLGTALSACTAQSHLGLDTPSAAVSGSSTIIVYHSGTPSPILEAARQRGAQVIYDLRQVNAVALRLQDGVNIDQEIQYYEQLKGVGVVTRDGVNQLYGPN